MLREKPQMSEADYAAKMSRKELTADGAALIPDPTPVAPPLGYTRQPSITERIREMVRSEHLRQAAEAAGVETFEEANDFEVGDDFDPASPYEEVYEPPADVSTGVPSPGGGEGAGGPSEGAGVPPQPAPVPSGPPASTAPAALPKAGTVPST